MGVPQSALVSCWGQWWETFKHVCCQSLTFSATMSMNGICTKRFPFAWLLANLDQWFITKRCCLLRHLATLFCSVCHLPKAWYLQRSCRQLLALPLAWSGLTPRTTNKWFPCLAWAAMNEEKHVFVTFWTCKKAQRNYLLQLTRWCNELSGKNYLPAQTQNGTLGKGNKCWL